MYEYVVILSDRLQLCYAISSACNGGFWSTAPTVVARSGLAAAAVSLSLSLSLCRARVSLAAGGSGVIDAVTMVAMMVVMLCCCRGAEEEEQTSREAGNGLDD